MTISLTRNCLDHEFLSWPTKPSTCLICLRRYNAKYQSALQNKVREFLNDYRLKSGCVQCGYNSNAAALQFDHITPVPDGRNRRKRSSLPKSMTKAKEFIADSNIQVLCANCHCIKTRENQDYKARVKI